jgi:hypothetical protein
MYIAGCRELRKNSISLELIYKPGMNMHIHWLNPLLFKSKD